MVLGLTDLARQTLQEGPGILYSLSPKLVYEHTL